MTDLLGILVPLILLIGVVALAAKWQTKQYRDYLAKHTASTEDLVQSQKATREAVERQTAALERIAIAIEKSRHS